MCNAVQYGLVPHSIARCRWCAGLLPWLLPRTRRILIAQWAVIPLQRTFTYLQQGQASLWGPDLKVVYPNNCAAMTTLFGSVTGAICDTIHYTWQRVGENFTFIEIPIEVLHPCVLLRTIIKISNNKLINNEEYLLMKSYHLGSSNWCSKKLGEIEKKYLFVIHLLKKCCASWFIWPYLLYYL